MPGAVKGDERQPGARFRDLVRQPLPDGAGDRLERHRDVAAAALLEGRAERQIEPPRRPAFRQQLARRLDRPPLELPAADRAGDVALGDQHPGASLAGGGAERLGDGDEDGRLVGAEVGEGGGKGVGHGAAPETAVKPRNSAKR